MNPFRILGIVVLVVMLGVLTWASLQQALWAVPAEVSRNRWFLATLADAYCGFIIFFAWVVSREQSMNSRVGWFAAILLLGNVATAIYLILAFGPVQRRRSAKSKSTLQ